MCALYVYLMTIFPLTLNISIDIAIGAPGHGKYVVEGLNMRDIIYLRGKMNILSKILPPLVKALVCFIMPLINQLLVSQNNAKIF